MCHHNADAVTRSQLTIQSTVPVHFFWWSCLWQVLSHQALGLTSNENPLEHAHPRGDLRSEKVWLPQDFTSSYSIGISQPNVCGAWEPQYSVIGFEEAGTRRQMFEVLLKLFRVLDVSNHLLIQSQGSKLIF